MATKVKGQAIKEGSIPMSALSEEIKDKIENAGGGADWNAQEGEAGYIENRPCYVNLNNGLRITLDNANITLSSDGNWYEKIIIPLQEPRISLYFYNLYGELIHYDLTEGQSVTDSHFGCNFTAVLNEYDLYDLVLTDFTDPKEYIDNVFAETKLVCDYNLNIIQQINPIYLPYTVLKTTPQTLSNNDKNQALDNLGIDYILKPSEIPQKPIVVLPPYVGEDYQYLNIPWNEIGFTEKHLGLLLKGISLGLITKDNIHEYFYPVDYIADYRVSGYEFNNNYIKFHVYDESQELGGDFVIRFDSKTIDMPLWE